MGFTAHGQAGLGLVLATGVPIALPPPSLRPHMLRPPASSLVLDSTAWRPLPEPQFSHLYSGVENCSSKRRWQDEGSSSQ